MIEFDHAVYMWVVTHRLGALNGPMWVLSALGQYGVVWFVIAGFTVRRTSRRRHWVQLGLVITLTTVIVDYVLKPAVHRERPFVTMPATHVIGSRPTDPSFPSGHTADAFAGAWTLTRVSPQPALWVLAIGIAYSRVYLGVHYPLDVLGGALTGLLSAVTIHVILRYPSGDRPHG
jgi:undecaprenyl-diphosphatase